MPLPLHTANRYLQPLREGGSLPAVVDTQGAGLWVVKFRGAGQGAKVLIAEIVVGLLAQSIGLPMPELALIEIPPPFGRSEPDSEIQEILRKSHGVNLGLRYLDGAFNFDAAAAGAYVSEGMAARIVWLDAFVTNPDRTHRNPNMLLWQERLYLIDHGAALYAHHDWNAVDAERTRTPFARIRDHVLLPQCGDLSDADAHATASLNPIAIEAILAQVPDDLLLDPLIAREFATPDESRARYVRYLVTRLESPRDFVREAIAAREAVRRDPPRRLEARR